MTFRDNLNKICKERNTTLTRMCKDLGVSTSKVTAINRGSLPNEEMMTKFAAYLQCAVVDFFAEEADSLLIHKDSTSGATDMVQSEYLSMSDKRLLKEYKSLDVKGKKLVDTIVEAVVEFDQDSGVEDFKEIGEYKPRPYTYPVSAGAGEYLGDIVSEYLAPYNTEEADKADFALRVKGDSMEPLYHDGDTVAVDTSAYIEQGDIVVVVLNDEGLIKKLGNGELISLNDKYKSIKLTEFDSLKIVGKVVGKVKNEDTQIQK